MQHTVWLIPEYTLVYIFYEKSHFLPVAKFYSIFRQHHTAKSIIHYQIKLLTFITKNLKCFVKIFVFDRAMCAFSFMKSIFCWSKGIESQDFRPTFFGQKLLCIPESLWNGLQRFRKMLTSLNWWPSYLWVRWHRQSIFYFGNYT